MPRPPAVSSRIASMPAGVFSRLAHRIANLEGEVYPLHVGDTWREPAVAARLEAFSVAEHPGMHRYTSPQGHPALLEAASKHWEIDAQRILVTAGATAGLSVVAGTLLEPGDEVLVLAPHWPLISGIVSTNRGVAVRVPFYDRQGSVSDLLAPFLTDRTVAVYVNTPSNPTGRVLDAATMNALASFAREQGLWLWADDIYEDYVYEGKHIPMRDLAPERTFTALSFSKAWGMAGNRVGLILGPEDPEISSELRKLGTHRYYSAPTGPQLAAARVLTEGSAWLAETREQYRRAGEDAAEVLGLEPPAGGTFLFVNVSDALEAPGEAGLHGFLSRCMDENLILAPGSACGPMYADHVRVCFTCAPPDVVARGFRRLAGLLGRASL